MLKRMLRIAKLALVVMAGVIAVLVLAVMTLCLPPVQRLIVRRAEARVEQVLKGIATTGAPVKLMQLAKPPIPDAQNAALVYRKAFPGLHGISEHRQFIGRVASEEASLADPGVAAEAKEILRTNAEAVRLIHQASAMPRCDFRLEWTKSNELTFPHFRYLRNCSYLLSLEASMLAHQGRADDAVAACRANLRLSSAADEPILIGQVVRYAVVAISCRSLNTVVRDSQPSPSACRSLAKDIARLDIATRYIDTFKGERAMGIAVFEQVRASPDPMKAILDLAGEPGDNGAHPAVFAKTAFTRWWLASDELTYLRLMGQVIQEASLSYRKVVRVHPSVEDRLNALAARPMPPRILTAILLPTLKNASMARDRAIARLGPVQVALLLKAYRAEQGNYPESLAELGRINGRALPTDPFSGKPFVYRREGAGFMVYSWGPNLKDDGGMSPRKDERNEGDIVFRCTR